MIVIKVPLTLPQYLTKSNRAVTIARSLWGTVHIRRTRFSIFHLPFFICHLKTGSPAPGRSLCPVMTNEKWQMENGKSSSVPPSQPANSLSLCHIRDRSNFLQLLPRGGTEDLIGPLMNNSPGFCKSAIEKRNCFCTRKENGKNE